MKMLNPVPPIHNPVAIKKTTEERNHMCSVSVGKPFPGKHSSLDIRDLKAERNATAVMNVGQHP